MNLTGDLLRGHTDMIIMAVLRRSDSYGYAINKTIQEFSDHAFSLTEATLYTSFKRLEARGYITSYWQESESGKKRKYYALTDKGNQALNEQEKAWEDAKKIIDGLR